MGRGTGLGGKGDWGGLALLMVSYDNTGSI